MKYFFVLLILIGFFSSANAIQYQSSETDKPVNSENSIHVVPEILWDIHDVILDGTIVEYDNNTWTYHIKINQIFKGSLNSDLISAEGFDVWNNFKKGDRALFYIYDISPVSTNYKYKITGYSVKTTPTCDARSLIQITPTLPNEGSFVRGAPTIPADWEDPCVPNYFSYDPDFFNFREAIAPLKQIKHKIPIDKIQCYDDKVLLFRNSDGAPACVKSSSMWSLTERDWMKLVTFETISGFPRHEIENGRIISMKLVKDESCFPYIIITIDSKDSGNLEIFVSRNILDPKINGQDDSFLVLEDGIEVAYDERDNSTEYRILNIPFEKGAKSIEIIATCLI